MLPEVSAFSFVKKKLCYQRHASLSGLSPFLHMGTVNYKIGAPTACSLTSLRRNAIPVRVQKRENTLIAIAFFVWIYVVYVYFFVSRLFLFTSFLVIFAKNDLTVLFCS